MDCPVVKEVKVKIGKATWLIPIRKSRGVGFFARVDGPLFIHVREKTVEAVEKKLHGTR